MSDYNQDLIKKLNDCWNEYYPMIKPETIGGLERYLTKGYMPGSFMTACLENNLREAVGRADSDNIRMIPQIVGLLYNGIPSSAWGSPENVAEWVAEIRKAAA